MLVFSVKHFDPKLSLPHPYPTHPSPYPPHLTHASNNYTQQNPNPRYGLGWVTQPIGEQNTCAAVLPYYLLLTNCLNSVGSQQIVVKTAGEITVLILLGHITCTVHKLTKVVGRNLFHNSAGVIIMVTLENRKKETGTVEKHYGFDLHTVQ